MRTIDFFCFLSGMWETGLHNVSRAATVTLLHYPGMCYLGEGIFDIYYPTIPAGARQREDRAK